MSVHPITIIVFAVLFVLVAFLGLFGGALAGGRSFPAP